jgi:hypothetical protein
MGWDDNVCWRKMLVIKTLLLQVRSVPMDLAASFLALPDGSPNHNIQQAYQIVSETYKNSLHALHQDGNDPLRIQFHIDRLRQRIFPLYTALSTEELPSDWLKAGAHVLGRLLVELEATRLSVNKE